MHAFMNRLKECSNKALGRYSRALARPPTPFSAQPEPAALSRMRSSAPMDRWNARGLPPGVKCERAPPGVKCERAPPGVKCSGLPPGVKCEMGSPPE
jgi:hypothetical protein